MPLLLDSSGGESGSEPRASRQDLKEGQDSPESGSSEQSTPRDTHDVHSKGSGSERSESKSETEKQSELLARMKRQARTLKARTASLIARSTRRLSKNADLKPPEHPAHAFKDDLKVSSILNQPGQNSTYPRSRRLRLGRSWPSQGPPTACRWAEPYR